MKLTGLVEWKHDRQIGYMNGRMIGRVEAFLTQFMVVECRLGWSVSGQQILQVDQKSGSYQRVGRKGVALAMGKQKNAFGK